MLRESLLPRPKLLSSSRREPCSSAPTRTEAEVLALRGRLRLAWELAQKTCERVLGATAELQEAEDQEFDSLDEIRDHIRTLETDARQGLADLAILESRS